MDNSYNCASPLMFSESEDDEEKETFLKTNQTCLSSTISSHISDNPILKEQKQLLGKFEMLMNGLPPPPSLAVCYLSCDEMLAQYHKNKCAFELPKPLPGSITKESTLLSCLNDGVVSEKLAIIMQRVQERYIQRETMSTCNIWFKDLIPLSASAKKLKKGVHSPGRRLSHLARRRQVFSKDNLQQLAKSEKNVLEIKTFKTTAPKPVQPSQLNPVPRRALFQSPDNFDPNSETSRPGFKTVVKPTFRISRRMLGNKGNLNDEHILSKLNESNNGYDVSGWIEGHDFQAGRKRSRHSDLDESITKNRDKKRKCPRRSLTFDEYGDDSRSSSGVSSVPASQCSHISELHKKKLLWAVSTALTERKIAQKDPNFRTFASKLFNLCKISLNDILSSLKGGDSSTSDKMLAFARKQVDNVIEKPNIEEKLLDKGKENRIAVVTPLKRIPIIKPRTWHTCVKKVSNQEPLLYRSRSFDSILHSTTNTLSFDNKSFIEGSQEMGKFLCFPALDSFKSFENEDVPIKNQDFQQFYCNSNDLQMFCNETFLAEETTGINEIELNLTVNHETPSVTVNITENICDTVDVSLLDELTKNYHPANGPEEEQLKNDSDHESVKNDSDHESVKNDSDHESVKSDYYENVPTPSTPIIIKKNRENWKVIHTPSGPELKLKMRLYQEWEVVNKEEFQELSPAEQGFSVV